MLLVEDMMGASMPKAPRTRGGWLDLMVGGKRVLRPGYRKRGRASFHNFLAGIFTIETCDLSGTDNQLEPLQIMLFVY
jgi:hypothetical protein